MLKAQTLVLNLLALVLLILAGVLVVQNLAVQVPVQVLTQTLPQFSLGVLLGLGVVLGAGSVLLRAGAYFLAAGQQQRRISRELERKDVSREEAQEKVKVLENKVQTLEKALNEALKRS